MRNTVSFLGPVCKFTYLLTYCEGWPISLHGMAFSRSANRHATALQWYRRITSVIQVLIDQWWHWSSPRAPRNVFIRPPPRRRRPPNVAVPRLHVSNYPSAFASNLCSRSITTAPQRQFHGRQLGSVDSIRRTCIASPANAWLKFSLRLHTSVAVPTSLHWPPSINILVDVRSTLIEHVITPRHHTPTSSDLVRPIVSLGHSIVTGSVGLNCKIFILWSRRS